MRIRHSALTTIAAGLCMVAAVLCLGQLGASLLNVTGPLDAALGGSRSDVRLAEVERDRTVRVADAEARERTARRPRTTRRTEARSDRAAVRPRRSSGARRRATREGRRGAARVGGQGRTSRPATGEQPAQPTPVPTETTDSSATIVASGGESSGSGTRSASGTSSGRTRSLLSVAGVSVVGGTTSGSLGPGSELRVKLAVADPVATASTMDLRMKLDAREIEMLTAKAAKSEATGTAATPLALRARLDVVDAADAAPEGELRVRLQLAPAPAATAATAVDAGDAGGRSNAVDVWAPIERPAGDPDPESRPDERELAPEPNAHQDRVASPGEERASEAPAAEHAPEATPAPETSPTPEATPTPEPTPAPEPAAVEGDPIEFRLPLAPTEAAEPASEEVTVPLPAEQDGAETPARHQPADTGIEVEVEMTVETAPAEAPPADTDTPADETPATDPSAGTAPAPPATP